MKHAGDPAPTDWKKRIKKFNQSTRWYFPQKEGGFEYGPDFLTAKQAGDMLGIDPSDFELLVNHALIHSGYRDECQQGNTYCLEFIYFKFISGKKYELELLQMRDDFAKKTGNPKMSRRQAKRNEKTWFRCSSLPVRSWEEFSNYGDDGVQPEVY